MKFKKLISFFLILVLAIQLLPVRQVIQYFFIDNQITEELAATAKAPAKMQQLDEDKLLHDLDIPVSEFVILNKDAFFHFSDRLPALYTADILTPPPNHI